MPPYLQLAVEWPHNCRRELRMALLATLYDDYRADFGILRISTWEWLYPSRTSRVISRTSQCIRHDHPQKEHLNSYVTNISKKNFSIHVSRTSLWRTSQFTCYEHHKKTNSIHMLQISQRTSQFIDHEHLRHEHLQAHGNSELNTGWPRPIGCVIFLDDTL